MDTPIKDIEISVTFPRPIITVHIERELKDVLEQFSFGLVHFKMIDNSPTNIVFRPYTEVIKMSSFIKELKQLIDFLLKNKLQYESGEFPIQEISPFKRVNGKDEHYYDYYNVSPYCHRQGFFKLSHDIVTIMLMDRTGKVYREDFFLNSEKEKI